MSATLDRERLIRDIVRLRRAELSGAPDEVGDVRDDLERLVGPSVSRALAARVLGITQSALDRHVAKGAIPVVPTADGRREVPLSALVALALDLDEARRSGVVRHPLGAALRVRRERARRLDTHALLPPELASSEGHRGAELRSLALHRAIARRLDRQLVLDARRRLRRWRAEGAIDERWAREWERVLSRPIPEIARVIAADGSRERDLRQSSPFAGALPHEERQRILELVGEVL